MAKRKNPAPACLFFALALASCGLEDVPFMSRLPHPWHSDLSGATISLHVAEGAEYLSHFIIFYRIYLSPVDSGSPYEDRAAIHATMQADYAHFRPWVDGAATGTAVAGAFINRQFLQLEVEGAAIGGRAGVLGEAALGATLEIDFEQSPGRSPRLLLNGAPRYLRRATHSAFFSGGFEPQPRLGDPPPSPNHTLPFFNHPYLLDRENARPATAPAERPNINDDVAPVLAAQTAELTNAYVMMYIVAAGLGHGLPPPPVFSMPMFLGIFRLPPF